MMITSGKDYLLDTNILVFSQDKESSKHENAIKIIDELELKTKQIFLTIQNLLEYSAVLSRFYKIPNKQISEDLKIFIKHPSFKILYPMEDVSKEFNILLENNPKLYIYDLYLVAYMKTFGIKNIVTDDEDFKEIKGINVLNPFQ